MKRCNASSMRERYLFGFLSKKAFASVFEVLEGVGCVCIEALASFLTFRMRFMGARKAVGRPGLVFVGIRGQIVLNILHS